jgi:glycosyltransferase involved in cell wall biosynthesis
MPNPKSPSEQQPAILLIGPGMPPYGGMGLQARQLCELLESDGLQVIFSPSNPAFPRWLRFLELVRGGRPIFRSILFAWLLWKALREADVVHVMACSWLSFFVVTYPAVWLSYWARKRTVVNYRGGEAERFFQWFGWLAGPVFRRADVITAPSGFLAGIIERRFHVPVAIVPNILNLSAFRFRQRTTFRPKMLVTRHLEKIYDIESVLRAFRIVAEKYPEASLWIAGTGSEEQHLRKLVSQWGLTNVEFLGHVRHQDLPSIYDACDIYVNASRFDNFPAGLLEASASGLAIVSTCAGGIPFIYQNEKNALLVPPRDWEGLALAVEKVLECPLQSADFTRDANILAQACDWHHVRKSLYRAYWETGENDHCRPAPRWPAVAAKELDG